MKIYLYSKIFDILENIFIFNDKIYLYSVIYKFAFNKKLFMFNEKYLIFKKIYLYSINYVVFNPKYLYSIKNIFILTHNIILHSCQKSHSEYFLFFTSVQLTVSWFIIRNLVCKSDQYSGQDNGI